MDRTTYHACGTGASLDLVRQGQGRSLLCLPAAPSCPTAYIPHTFGAPAWTDRQPCSLCSPFPCLPPFLLTPAFPGRNRHWTGLTPLFCAFARLPRPACNGLPPGGQANPGCQTPERTTWLNYYYWAGCSERTSIAGSGSDR